MTRSTRILGGVFALVLAAVLFASGEFFLSRPDLLATPGADPEAFAQMVTGAGFAFYAGRGLVGCFLEAVSMIALYGLLQAPRTEPWAFWGMIVSLLGDLFGAVFFGTLFFVYPDVGELLLEGQRDVLGVVEPSLVLLAIMFLPAVIGFGLFAVALWRSEFLPSAAGLLLVVGFLLLAVQIFAVQLLANVVWGLGALWIFVRARRTRERWAPGGTPFSRR